MGGGDGSYSLKAKEHEGEKVEILVHRDGFGIEDVDIGCHDEL